jgi:hypothetical protein
MQVGQQPDVTAVQLLCRLSRNVSVIPRR